MWHLWRSLAATHLELFARCFRCQFIEVDVLQIPQPGAEFGIFGEVVLLADGCHLQIQHMAALGHRVGNYSSRPRRQKNGKAQEGIGILAGSSPQSRVLAASCPRMAVHRCHPSSLQQPILNHDQRSLYDFKQSYQPTLGGCSGTLISQVGHRAYAASGTFWLPSHGAFPPRAVSPSPYPAPSHAALLKSPTLTGSKKVFSKMAAIDGAHLLLLVLLVLTSLSVRFRVCRLDHRGAIMIEIGIVMHPCASEYVHHQSAACCNLDASCSSHLSRY